MKLPDNLASLCLFLLVLPGCASTLAPATGDLSVDLRHADPRVRIDAALQVVADDRAELAALLIENLSDEDGAVRLFNAVALRKLTGENYGYKPYGTWTERDEAVRRWKTWLAATKTGATRPRDERESLTDGATP